MICDIYVSNFVYHKRFNNLIDEIVTSFLLKHQKEHVLRHKFKVNNIKNKHSCCLEELTYLTIQNT